jgi:uncharacterized membrane protein (DUF373 family)
MEKVVGKIEQYISYALIFVGLTFATYQTVELVAMFISRLWQSVSAMEFLEDVPGRPVAGLFFSVLLTLELIATVRVFAEDHMIKIRVILLVGLIAVTRKILELDMEHMNPTDGVTVAALILALSLGYFLVSRSVDGHAKKVTKE